MVVHAGQATKNFQFGGPEPAETDRGGAHVLSPTSRTADLVAPDGPRDKSGQMCPSQLLTGCTLKYSPARFDAFLCYSS